MAAGRGLYRLPLAQLGLPTSRQPARRLCPLDWRLWGGICHRAVCGLACPGAAPPSSRHRISASGGRRRRHYCAHQPNGAPAAGCAGADRHSTADEVRPSPCPSRRAGGAQPRSRSRRPQQPARPHRAARDGPDSALEPCVCQHPRGLTSHRRAQQCQPYYRDSAARCPRLDQLGHSDQLGRACGSVCCPLRQAPFGALWRVYSLGVSLVCRPHEHAPGRLSAR
nr:hypothetical protein NCPCFENI_01375 [Cupriavidus sp.]